MGEVFQGIGNGYEGAVMRRERPKKGEVLAAPTRNRYMFLETHLRRSQEFWRSGNRCTPKPRQTQWGTTGITETFGLIY